MIRKRPVGQAFKKFCKDWDEADHEHKIRLCADLGVTYETARHWRSDHEEDEPEPSAAVGVTEAGAKEVLFEVEKLAPEKQLDFVCFDLETSNLKADFSIILCATIKPYGNDPIVFRADEYEEWNTDRANDKGIVVDVALELAKHAIVVTHYGSKFDIPYLRAKMVKYGLEPLPPMFALDTLQVARSSFCVSSRRLENLSRYFELGGKSAVDGQLWNRAAYGQGVACREALDAIVEHNLQDVYLLEKLAALSFPYVKSVKRL